MTKPRLSAKVLRTLITTMLVVTCAATPALARKRPVVAAVVQVVQKVDTDSSKTISSGEWTAAGGQAATFTAVDANASGQIGFFELLYAFVARYMAMHAQ